MAKVFFGHMSFLAHGNMLSRDVLLDVCRWMEDHPNTNERDAIDKDEVENLLALIEGTLTNEETKARAVSALSYLKKEGNRTFFERLLCGCPTRITANGEIITSLMNARKLRGTHAHSNHAEIDFVNLEEAVTSLETLCNWLLPHSLTDQFFSEKAKSCHPYHPLFSYARFRETISKS